MREDVKKKWVAALRSGEYAQTRNYLAVTEVVKDSLIKPGFCCLGVLCEVAIENGVPLEVDTINSKSFGYKEYDEMSGNLPPSVKKFAGINVESVLEVPYEGDIHNLATLNDVYGLDFNQIADIIEREL